MPEKTEYIQGKPWKPGQIKRRGTEDTIMWTDKEGKRQVRYLKRQKIKPLQKAKAARGESGNKSPKRKRRGP